MEEQRQSVLIVDDSRVGIEFLNDMLKGDYNILFATNGAEALEIAHREEPDIILLDVIMPGMDGHEVCARLKTDPATVNIPVIFITGRDQEDDEAKGLDLGAIDYITKPIRPAIVRARVRNHLELKSYRDFLEGLSMTDGLTGIHNRRAFDECLEREWRRSLRGTSALSLVIADIDFFKQFNDRYGHLSGDDCLRKVAQSVAENIRRPLDLVARYGGEEFAAILPDTDCAGAMTVTGHIQAGIRSLGIPHESSATGFVTLSMGVASMVPSLGTGPFDLIDRADTHLYAAKKKGRNRIVSGDGDAA